MAYNGSPWRSRFLRAPKVGLELASRSDFTALSTVATARLGMKTGNDGFFFLRARSRPSGGKVNLVGLNNFECTLSLRDLSPALQNPRDLDTREGRLPHVPTTRGRYSGDSYYFAPRARLDADARSYIRWGELQEVNRSKLVRDNAGGADWYRQVREKVTSRWALPYNSGYNYEVIDNTPGALLNGRFVGVDAIDIGQNEVLGAILNSTPVTMMRLLEGVATGNEGAFDVGPPAVRVMRIPDLRRFTDEGRARLLHARDAISEAGHLPEAPNREGDVDPLRRALDLAVFTGLGVGKGDATVLLDRIYASYGRWRGAVEDVEAQMQENRRALSRRGGTRSETSAQRTVRRVWDEVSAVTPSLFERLTEHEWQLVDPILATRDDDQQMLFATTSHATPSGDLVDLKDARRVDLARTIRDLGVSGPFALPQDPTTAQSVRDAVIRLQAVTASDIERRTATYVSADLVPEVVDAVMRRWISRSIADLRERMNREPDVTLSGPDLFQTDGLLPPMN